MIAFDTFFTTGDRCFPPFRTQVTPGLPVVTLKAMENMIASDRMLSTMNINGADVMDLSFLKQLEEERKSKR